LHFLLQTLQPSFAGRPHTTQRLGEYEFFRDSDFGVSTVANPAIINNTTNIRIPKINKALAKSLLTDEKKTSNNTYPTIIK
jgi:hypothetical protein